ncbi:HDOD domain-containing protein [Melaminivora sp.]|uniref:EAL and HDOD domain-containing protein n=1 Tax=Melaminivora sp. TaxID=1933032 RepID=UPI0028AD51BD|nr:HDOD domain-containing protein [Melaminivora sp.]
MSAPPPSFPSAAPGALIARQAIVDHHRTAVGYELFGRSRAAHAGADDASLVLAALSHEGHRELAGRLLLFVNCTHENLGRGHLDLVQPEQVVLQVPPLGHAAATEVHAREPLLAALRRRGFRLAFDRSVLESTYAPWLPLADYIKLNLSVLAPDKAVVLANYAGRHSDATLVAEKVESAQQYDMAAALGVRLFQGFWFARPTLVQSHVLTPAQGIVVQLLNLVRRQAPAEELEAVLKKDAGLAFNLLRLINSASLGLSREIVSLRQAVLLLGLDRLFRWAALLLTTARGAAPAAVGQTAVVRGRFMELLAPRLLPPEEVEQAFVVGLFSLLDRLLGMPLQDALDLLHLPAGMAEALVHRRGVAGALLDLVVACESGDAGTLPQAARALGLDEAAVNTAHLQALQWADALQV